MIRNLTFASAFTHFLLGLATAQSGGWEIVGPPSFSAAHVTSCRIAFDSEDVPYVSYQDLDLSSARASVKRFVDDSWQYVGQQGGASVATAWYNQIALDAENNVYVANRDYGTSSRINVRSFPASGGAWTSLGVNGFSMGEAHYTALALRADGMPYVAYADRETTPVDRASAMRFANGVWEFIGPQGLSPNTAGYTDIALASDGTPYVVFADTDYPGPPSTDGKATVLRYDSVSQSWTAVGSPGFSQYGASNVVIALDAQDVPWIAYYLYHLQIIVEKFDGARWIQVGGSASGPDRPDVQTEGWRQWLSLCFDSQNAPYVAYQLYEGGLKAAVRRFDGTSWSPVGAIGFSAGPADYMALAIDSKDVPYVVFRDTGNGGGVTVMRYAPSPLTYCSAKTSSIGCTPSIAASGTPSLSSASPFIVSANQVINQKTGMLLYASGPAHNPFFGGYLCLEPPVLRTPAQHSGGTVGGDDCSGTYALDMNPILQGSGRFSVGQMLFAQYWYRDPQDPQAVGLSNAVRATVGP